MGMTSRSRQLAAGVAGAVCASLVVAVPAVGAPEADPVAVPGLFEPGHRPSESGLAALGDGAVVGVQGSSGTELFLASPDGARHVYHFETVEEVTRVGNRVFFVASLPMQSFPSLWVSDGTTAGTRLVKTVRSTADAHLQELTAAGDRLYFTADDGVHGQELWTSDGTTQGTHLVRDITPGPAATSTIAARYVAVGSRVYFQTGGLGGGPHGNAQALWVSDGTEAGTVQLADSSHDAQDVARSGDGVVFSAEDTEHGREVWSSDGTAAGTRMAHDVVPGPASSLPGDLVPFDGDLYLTAVLTPGTRSLVRVRGASVTPVMTTATTVDLLQPLGDRLVLGGRDSTSDSTALWTVDGTIATRFRVLEPGDSFRIDLAAAVGGRLYLTDNARLWATDGTDRGTALLHTFSVLDAAVSTGSRLYYLGNVGRSGEDDWNLWTVGDVPDRQVTGASLRAQRPQRPGPRLRVRVRVGAGEQVKAVVTGSVRARGLRARQLRGMSVTVRSRASRSTVLQVRAKDRRAVRRALARFRHARGAARTRLRLQVAVRVVFRDAEGNTTTRRTTIRLR